MVQEIEAARAVKHWFISQFLNLNYIDTSRKL